MNNFEKIKQMSVDEMAEFIANLTLTSAEKAIGASRNDSEQINELINELLKMVKQYLLQEVEE